MLLIASKKFMVIIAVLGLMVAPRAQAQESCGMTLKKMQDAMRSACQSYAKVLAPRLATQGIRIDVRSVDLVASPMTGTDQIQIKTSDGRVIALHNNPNVFAYGTGGKQGLVCQAVLAADQISGVFDAKTDAALAAFDVPLVISANSVMSF